MTGSTRRRMGLKIRPKQNRKQWERDTRRRSRFPFFSSSRNGRHATFFHCSSFVQVFPHLLFLVKVFLVQPWLVSLGILVWSAIFVHYKPWGASRSCRPWWWSPVDSPSSVITRKRRSSSQEASSILLLLWERYLGYLSRDDSHDATLTASSLSSLQEYIPPSFRETTANIWVCEQKK